MKQIASENIKLAQRIPTSRAIEFVQTAKKYNERIYLYHKTQAISCKSLSAVVALMMIMKRDEELLLIVEGEKAKNTIHYLKSLLIESSSVQLKQPAVT
jgi:phosphotransferase system HPr-like phosphotransfer protein